MTSTVIYKGALRTEATHLASSTTLLTDAPVDNQGKGETFSPTDLVASALASCMLTIMGIKADARGRYHGNKSYCAQTNGCRPAADCCP